MKTVVRAGLAAVLAVVTVLASPAEAATTKQVTSTCRDGDFTGRFTLRYETSAGYHRPIGSITTSGPYIGDSGTQSLRISYREGTATHTVYTRVGPATEGTRSLPAGLAVPVTARGAASTTFDNGAASCTATVPIT
jgi:hypothetical protein